MREINGTMRSQVRRVLSFRLIAPPRKPFLCGRLYKRRRIEMVCFVRVFGTNENR